MILVGTERSENFLKFLRSDAWKKEPKYRGQKILLLFMVLNCSSGQQKNELLCFTFRNIPSHAMVDSGELISSAKNNPKSEKKRKRDISDASSDSLNELKKAVKSQNTTHESTQKVRYKTELLKQLSIILQMRRELGPGEDAENEVLNTELEKFKASLGLVCE